MQMFAVRGRVELLIRNENTQKKVACLRRDKKGMQGIA